ncbi:patatin-like phospholipase family protein [Azospira restricta]|uniref:Patatin-like phospholipase family protein n=1 Tax=Azospira restricta TaxID=404405 RepID=A0A974PWH0_9RHOO|nr:patatin-like phospholipase family protein [Azospira restricta]QRJ62611.1 patatin-like phospholipase family protein [Azospira restricta]
MKIGVALGSGSARGWAHIGVLRALAEMGVEPDIVCGTSIGAFVGAAHADGDLESLEAWVRTLSWQSVVSFFDIGGRGGMIKGDKLMAYFARYFVDRDFDDLPRPFACVATDLTSGREVWLKEGSVASAVRASIALPGLFAPQLRNERLLVDGGLVNPVPVSLARALGADVVIAVDLGSDLVSQRFKAPPAPSPASPWRQRLGQLFGRSGEAAAAGGNGNGSGPSLLDVVAGSINIMQVRIARSRLAGEPADVLVAPRLAQMGLLDFHRGAEAIDEGVEAVRVMQPAILRALGRD